MLADLFTKYSHQNWATVAVPGYKISTPALNGSQISRYLEYPVSDHNTVLYRCPDISARVPGVNAALE